ncbi:hypothetical protein DH2020_027203 [Rehmannia glutinosa]|uniref:Xylulose kinase n=1 Tax=Rehmannia glutinosa TaxID=99300 RepID=A0ABR0VWN5_REHGL
MEDYSLPQGSYFLGFDSSTQSLKATVLDANLNIVAQEIVNFDSELPNYKTKDGVYRDPSVNGRIVSPTIMWVEAFDLILQRLQKSGLEFGKIAAVSGSGQQHGSVYWKAGSSRKLSSFDPKKKLVDQLGEAFSVNMSPVWMDSSTTEQCKEIEKAIGGALELSKITGSRGYACIDHTDGAGMNLMDIKERAWSKRILEVTAPGLEEKLGKLLPAYAVAGLIAPYFVERYHFDKNCLIIQWSGDNPNSLADDDDASYYWLVSYCFSWSLDCVALMSAYGALGLTLNSPGDLAISLGTSDTLFGITAEHKPCSEGHVFPNPVDTEGYMVMLCYKNGSLTREGGKLGFYYKDHEIIPPLPVGFHRYVLENFNGDTLDGVKECEVAEFDAPSEVRALVEGQFLSMRAHAERFGMPSPPKRIIATGGASANDSILGSVASIFGCNVYKVQSSGKYSASMGAALRAAHGWLCNKKGNFVPISSMYMDKLDKTSLNYKLAVTAGDQLLVSNYTLFMKKRLEIENRVVDIAKENKLNLVEEQDDHMQIEQDDTLEKLVLRESPGVIIISKRENGARDLDKEKDKQNILLCNRQDRLK